jgi:hypothetical protein
MLGAYVNDANGIVPASPRRLEVCSTIVSGSRENLSPPANIFPSELPDVRRPPRDQLPDQSRRIMKSISSKLMRTSLCIALAVLFCFPVAAQVARDGAAAKVLPI